MIEVIDTRLTGETILDEALKMMKQQEASGEKLAINTWIDLLSGAPSPFSYTETSHTSALCFFLI